MTLGPLMVDIASTALDSSDRQLLRRPMIGGVILFARNYESPEQLAALVGEIHDLRSPALLVAVDQEGGRVQRFREGFTELPAARFIGKQYDLDAARGERLAEACGWIMAMELGAAGVDMSFAPVIDIDRGLCDAIGDRSFHLKPDVVGILAQAYMRGMRKAGMAATAKHFPGHGGVAADSHVACPVDRRDVPDLDDDIAPYARLIGSGLPAVMMAHVSYPAMDRMPAGFSPAWIQQELRGRLGFAGAVVSDDLDMAGAAVAGNMAERAHSALSAGSDLLLVCNNREGALAVADALEDYSQPASQMRLVRLRGRYPLGDEPPQSHPEWEERQAVLAECLGKPALDLGG
ncbi:MAG: beta-N-acetylhexosaminidase [Pseudomonadota bacterium]